LIPAWGMKESLVVMDWALIRLGKTLRDIMVAEYIHVW
jgi:hypothetical protein